MNNYANRFRNCNLSKPIPTNESKVIRRARILSRSKQGTQTTFQITPSSLGTLDGQNGGSGAPPRNF